MQQVAKDIISMPIELTDTISDTKFRLVHIAAQRVRQLSAGAPPYVSTRSIKDTTVSLEEALAGKFKVIVGEDAKKAREEYRKREERARMEEQLSAKEEEIRKELSAYLSENQGEGVVDEDASSADMSDDVVEDDSGDVEESEESEA